MTSQPAARTPGATRAAPGEYVFDLAHVNHILGGPAYSTANGACVEGDRMIVGLMRIRPEPARSRTRTRTSSGSMCCKAPSAPPSMARKWT